MAKAEVPDDANVRWSFGTASRGRDGVVKFNIGTAVDGEEAAAFRAAFNMLNAFDPERLTDAYSMSAAQLVESLSARLAAGGNPAPSITRQVAAATDTWLSAFTRFRAELEATETQFGANSTVRPRFDALHRNDPDYRLVWELRNVSQHEGNAQHYFHFEAALDEKTKERSERYSIDLEDLYATSQVRGIAGLRALREESERVDLVSIIDRIDELHYELILDFMAANTEALDAAIARIWRASKTYAPGGEMLHMFRLDDEADGFRTGGTASFQLLAIDTAILPRLALALSIARAHAASSHEG